MRRYETYDGAMFQWMMSNGILGFGLLVRAFFGGSVQRYGLLGGALWAVSNFLVLPVVKLLGLGVGFALYHVVNLMVGYMVGRLGLFGAPRDEASIPLLRDASVLMLALSFVFMLRVEPHMSDGAADAGEDAHSQMFSAESEPASSVDLRDMLGHLDTVSPERQQQHRGAAGRDPYRAELLDEQQRARARQADTEACASSEGTVGSRRGTQSTPALSTVSNAAVGIAGSASAALLSIGQGVAVGINADVRRRPVYYLNMQRHVRTTGVLVSSPILSQGVGRSRTAPGLSVGAAEAAPEAAPSLHASACRTIATVVAGVGARGLGVMLAVLAGATTGLNAVPFDIWNATVRPPGVSTLTFVFSSTVGVYTASTVMYLLYGAAAAMRHPALTMKHSPVRPAYLSGFMWAVGSAGQMVAIEELGMAEAYVICAIGPVMVSALVSALVFGEIQGRANVIAFCAALGMQFTGVAMLALGS